MTQLPVMAPEHVMQLDAYYCIRLRKHLYVGLHPIRCHKPAYVGVM